MHTRPRNIPALSAVILLAVGFTIVMSGTAVARATFQSPMTTPFESTATVTAEPVFTPNADAFPTVAPLAPEVMPAQPIGVETTPTASGFLPPPTLVNPASLVPGQLESLFPQNPPLVGPAAPPEATPTEAPPEAPGAAQLIDSGVIALSYLWLCCGALLLAAAGLAIVWLSRRSRRR